MTNSNDNKLVRKITQDNLVTEKYDIIKNSLLGNYTDDGAYFIAPKIVEELVILEKHKKTSFNNSVFCTSNKSGLGEILFEINYTKDLKENKAIATLFLLESVIKINGYIENTIRTQIAQFNSPIDGFLEKSYNHFNIVVDYNDEGKEVKDDKFNESFLFAKMQYTKAMSDLTGEKYEEAYNKYFVKRLELLREMNLDFTNDVALKFDSEYSKIENYFLKNKNYKSLNELLDKCIEDVSETKTNYKEQEEEYNKKNFSSLSIFIADSQRITLKAENKVIDNLDKEDLDKVTKIQEQEKDTKSKLEEESTKEQANNSKITDEKAKNFYKDEQAKMYGEKATFTPLQSTEKTENILKENDEVKNIYNKNSPQQNIKNIFEQQEKLNQQKQEKPEKEVEYIYVPVKEETEQQPTAPVEPINSTKEIFNNMTTEKQNEQIDTTNNMNMLIGNSNVLDLPAKQVPTNLLDDDRTL